MSISKTGQFILNLNDPQYLVNNISKTNTMTDWSFGGNPTIKNGIVTMTGVNPAFNSINFTVNPTDIICFEFTVALPTPSTTTSGPGVYIGTRYGQAVYQHTFSHNTNTWVKVTSTTTNPYFLHSYNLSSSLTLKNYILGSAVDLKNVPFGETSNISYPARAIQLPNGITETNIRSGYNSNTSMVITFSNPQIYNIYHYGFHDNDNILIASIGKNWSNANNFYEY